MATISDIESQITALEKQIVQLKVRRNALIPLFRLPAELLSRVFEMLQEDGNTPDPDPSFKTNALRSTCHHLREVALRAPDLWTTLNCRRRRWAELCAIRAASVPLHLFIELGKADKYDNGENDERSDSGDISEYDSNNRATPKAILTAAQYLGRAQSASLSIPYYHPNKYQEATQRLRESLTEPSRILRDFKLNFSYRKPLPTPLLGGSCSSLTSLHLEYCIIFQLPHLPSLSTMICKSCAFKQGFMTLSDELRHMLRLKVLVLENSDVFYDGKNKPVAGQGFPLLPLLTHLDIYESPLLLSGFLSILPIPQQSLAIRIRPYGSEVPVNIVQDISSYVHQFCEWCTNVNGSPLVHLHGSDYSASWKWTLTFSRPGASDQDSQGGHHCEAKFGKESLGFFHPILPRVEKATIYAVQVGGEWDNVDFPDRDRGPLLVELKEVELCGLAYESDIRSLQEWLQHRKESGYPIARLVFVGAHAPLQQSPGAVVIISQVEEVVWVGPLYVRPCSVVTNWNEAAVPRQFWRGKWSG